MRPEPVNTITPDQLRVGLYIHLDLGWMDHPFTFSNFKIRNEGQIAQIKALGLKQLRYDPLRSDCEPSVQAPAAAAASALPRQTPAVADSPAEEKEAFETQRLEELRQAVHECEQKFAQAANAVIRIEREIHITPPKSMAEARALVDSMVESLLTEGDVVLHAMNDRRGMAEQYSHSLNVTVLAMILAKSLDMSEEEVRHLAMGALFHDIGKSQIPDRVTRKTDPLTKSELALIHEHCHFGAKFAENFKLDPRVGLIILQHHECIDGSGYPGKLKGEEIDRLARITAIVNTYDNLCNPLDLAAAMTPYEALANMFSRQRAKLDPSILKLLIKSMGVYPPGSIVRLSSGDHGMVISVNPSKPLRPCVMLHLPDIPRRTPMLIDLGEEASLSITHCLRPSQLPKEALDYLSPGKRISYYFDKEPPKVGQ
ncbi:MAG TPA: HD-GYP domain-containing protein [Methylophilaceae bacterium]|nr:HD-GYP domain-containing protein [Methylophilaceae bacterium]